MEIVQGAVRRRCFAAHEVILSLGAINTPKVLMQSGIGPEHELHRHGIGIVQHLPGVGQNHQDQVSFGCLFQYLKPPRVGNRCCDATLYWKSDASLDLPDIFSCQLGLNDAAIAKFGIPADTRGMFVGLAHPKSRGWYVFPVPMQPIQS